jgi:hypothetical protein
MRWLPIEETLSGRSWPSPKNFEAFIIMENSYASIKVYGDGAEMGSGRHSAHA